VASAVATLSGPGHVVLPYIHDIFTIKPYTILPIMSPSPCDMGLSAMDNDGASPSIIVPVRLLVEMVQCHFVLSGCYLAHQAISSSWVLCTPDQPSQCRRRASSTLHRGWV